jgi:hypothetical protein
MTINAIRYGESKKMFKFTVTGDDSNQKEKIIQKIKTIIKCKLGNLNYYKSGVGKVFLFTFQAVKNHVMIENNQASSGRAQRILNHIEYCINNNDVQTDNLLMALEHLPI